MENINDSISNKIFQIIPNELHINLLLTNNLNEYFLEVDNKLDIQLEMEVYSVLKKETYEIPFSNFFGI